MSLLAPWMLWGLLFAAPLALVYLLKIKPRRQDSVALFLWSGIIAEKKSSSLWKTLRDLWSLLLLLLVLLAIVFALSDPRVEGDDGADVLVVIDRSASMQMQDASESRFERAKHEVHQLIDAMDGHRKIALATLGSDLRFVLPRTDDVSALRKILASLKPRDAVISKQARSDVNALAKLSDGARIMLITDEPASSFDEGIEVLSVNHQAKNIGIVQCDLYRLPGAGRRLGLFFQCYSSLKEEQTLDVIIAQDKPDNVVKVLPQTIQPGLNDAYVTEIAQAPAGTWFVRLATQSDQAYQDDLAVDNQHTLFVAEADPIQIALRGERSFFLEACIHSFGGEVGVFAITEKDADVAISLGKDTGDPNLIVWNPTGDSAFWSEVGAALNESPIRVDDKEHPALRHLDAHVMRFAGAKKISAPKNAHILLSDEDGIPLLYTVRTAERHVAVVNMDPLAGDFVLSPSFPVMMHGLAHALSQRDEAYPALLATGEEMSVPAAQRDSQTKLSDPQQKEFQVTGSAFYQTEHSGLYHMSRDGHQWIAAIGMKHLTESAVHTETASRMKPIDSGFLPAYWLYIIGFLILLIEAALYHRRKVG